MAEPVMEMPCGCTVNTQYLPLNGGQRRFECQHDVYMITGVKRTLTEFKVHSEKELKELGKRLTEQ